MVKLISQNIHKPDITRNFKALHAKKPIKNLSLDKKLEELDKTGLSYQGDLTGKTILLIDDKYQSGSTIQYIAMVLQKAGAARVYGLCTVSTLRNSDNQ